MGWLFDFAALGVGWLRLVQSLPGRADRSNPRRINRHLKASLGLALLEQRRTAADKFVGALKRASSHFILAVLCGSADKWGSHPNNRAGKTGSLIPGCRTAHAG